MSQDVIVPVEVHREEDDSQKPGIAEPIRPNTIAPPWYYCGIGAVVLVSIFLNFYQLGRDGFPNLYYAAAVKSMLMNWHNFFFVSFDPAGFVTIDKPPVGFWLQTLSAKLLGYSAFSVLFPQALAGVLSVVLLAYLVRRQFGPVAGLIAAALLATTPINIMANRNQTVDSLLILTLLFAVWTLQLALETGKLRWLLACMLLMALGFNIKTLEAYLLLPTVLLLYLLTAPLSWRKRLLHLVLSLVVLLVFSLSWVIYVDLTPPTQRPYVGSSWTNSELNLAIGYNGLQRMSGVALGASLDPKTFAERQAIIKRLPLFMQTRNEIGVSGVLRLMLEPLGGQIGWFFPLALLGMIAAGWEKRRRVFPLDVRQRAMVIWALWFLTCCDFFLSGVFFHVYYTALLAPALSALAAIGVVSTWQDRAHARRRWLLPSALLLVLGEQIYLFISYFSSVPWLLPFILLISVPLLLVLCLRRHVSPLRTRQLVSFALVVFLVGPTCWSLIPVLQDRNWTFPYAGPQRPASRTESQVIRIVNQINELTPAMISYLVQHQGHARFVAASIDSFVAAPLIVSTGKAAMALAGYQGSDTILNLNQLRQVVRQGTVRYFLIPKDPLSVSMDPQTREALQNYTKLGPLPGDADAHGSVDWIRQSCRIVPSAIWQKAATSHDARTGQDALLQIYDCASPTS